MPETVVIRLRNNADDQLDWIVVDDLGVPVEPPRQGELTDVAATANGRKIVALMPSFSILRTVAEVPLKSGSKLLQALPFAMEEKLAEDIDELHFAIGSRDEQNRFPVLVVRRDRVSGWLKKFTDDGLDISAMYADSEALGKIPGTSVLLVESDRVTLCDDDGTIAIVDHGGLEPLLELWLANRQPEDADDDNARAPTNLLVYATPECQESLDPVLNEIRARIDMLDVKVLPDGPLPRMASQIVVHPGINLLQGVFVHRSDMAVHWSAWKNAAILFLCLIGTLIGIKAVEVFQLNQQSAALDEAIEQGFRATFPEIRDIQDPQAELQRKLREMGHSSGATGDSRFLDVLEAIATAFPASSELQVELEALNFRSGTMDLRLRTPNVETLDRIQKEIAKNATMQTEIQSANPDGDSVLGRLQITINGS